MKGANILVSLCFILILFGCTWDPPHDNPVDPEHYRYQPNGRLQLSVIETDHLQPLSRAEVRIPDLGRVDLTDDDGMADFYEVPVGEYIVHAERIGNGYRSYALDSLTIIVSVGVTVRDTILLDPLPQTPGSLSMQIINYNQQPIKDATALVTLTNFDLSKRTDSLGLANFDDVPAGEWWVSAFRTDIPGPIYARDSILVVINTGAPTYVSLRLDALPYFVDVSVNAITIAFQHRAFNKLRLKARVEDPDGPSDLDYVEYQFEDTLTGDVISGRLAYNLESAYWVVEIPSENLPGGNIDNATNAPFRFFVFDDKGNSVATESSLLKVIHNAPDLNPRDIAPTPRPTLRWIYHLTDEFSDTTQFNYLVEIHQTYPDQFLFYDTLLVPIVQNNPSHTVDRPLQAGDYEWYIYVIDNFGNYSRSERGKITGVPEN